MSELLHWTDALSVGIEEIDAQHKELVKLINQLHNVIWEKRGTVVCMEILDKLVEYTRVHFAVEESLMRILRYPDYEPHRQEHEKLIAQVVELQRKLKSGEENVSFELMRFLKNWLIRHIVGTDKAYTPYFLSKGMEKTLCKKSVWKFW